MKKLYFFIITILIVNVSFAQMDGSLDSSFGTNGVQSLTNGFQGSNAKSVVVQPDGNILVGGFEAPGSNLDMTIIRLLPNGNTDNSFDSNGFVHVDHLGQDENCNAILLQNDGKILALGSTGAFGYQDIFISRSNIDGSLDSTFNSTGKLLWDPFGKTERLFSAALQPDEKILFAGTVLDTLSFTTDIFIGRLNSNGSIDSSFGNNGTVLIDLGTSDLLYRIYLQPNGKILLAGSATLNDKDLLVIRLLSNGTMDSTFSTNGEFITDINIEDEYWNGIAVDPDGKIILAGLTGDGTTSDLLVARLDSNGILDTTFAANGYFQNSFGFTYAQGYSLLLQPDGKILVGGLVANMDIDQALFRLDTDGNPDPTFGSNGLAQVLNPTFSDFIYDIAFQPDGKLVAAVTRYINTGTSWYMVASCFHTGIPTTISSMEFENSFVIYPNPVNNEFSISSSALEMDEKIDLHIFDLYGNEIYFIPSVRNNSRLNVSNLSNGVYFLYGHSNGKLFSQKLILQNQ
jgi:uncharacterized delta-60 repeat protein